MDFCNRIGVEIPVVQAGMGGGIAAPELAGIVSARGGLGTIGIMDVHSFDGALGRARDIAGAHRPLAANLIVPFTRPGHLAACVRHGVAVVTFIGGTGRRWIEPLHERGILVHVTVGNPAQARHAMAAGADGLVAQGIESGGHHMAVEPIADALPRILEVAEGRPVLAAGGVADAE
ncbi:MAG: nitronate monooxygenase, partial [Rhodanobacteraceae bacterium]